MTGEWKSLFAALGPRKPLQMNLSRLVHWLQLQGVAPSDVDDHWISAYIDYATSVLTIKKPIHAARVAARHWNMAAASITGWPPQILALPSSRTATRSPTLDELSPACRVELEKYKDLMKTGSDGGAREQFDLASFDDDEDDDHHSKGFAAYALTTQRQREQLLRRALGLLATGTHRPVSTVEFDELAAPKNAARILSAYKAELEHNDQAPALTLMAIALSGLARHFFKVDSKAVRLFRRLVDDAAKPTRDAERQRSGMTAKNARRLRQIGPDQVKALFQAPATLVQTTVERIHGNQATTSDLVDAQVGIAIAILLHAPVRAANLASIRVGQHLTLCEGDDGLGHLKFEPHETKTKRMLEFNLPLDLTRLLKLYVTEVLPGFERSMRTPALFAGLGNETKGSGLMGSQITARIAKIIAIEINQHLFRHLLAFFYLQAHPGKYEVVQDLLGHAKVETTRKYYCGMETQAAIKHFHETLRDEKLRAGLDPLDMSKINRESAATRKIKKG